MNWKRAGDGVLRDGPGALHRRRLGVGAGAVAGGAAGGAPLPCTGLPGHPGAVCRGYICVLILISGLVSEPLPTGAGLVVMGSGIPIY